MQQGFNRDVTVPIKVPASPTLKTNTGSLVGDITQVASFAIGLSDRNEAKALENVRQEKLKSANIFVDDLVTEYTTVVKQRGVAFAKSHAQRRISSNGTPNQSAFMSESFLNRVNGIDPAAGQGTAPKTLWELNANNETGSQALAHENLFSAPPVGTPERAALESTTARLVQNKQAYALLEKERKENGIKTKRKVNEVETVTKTQLSDNFKPLIRKAEDLLKRVQNAPPGERAALMEEIRGSVAVLRQAGYEFIDSSFVGVQDDLAKGPIESSRKSLDTVLDLFDTQDEAAMSLASRQLTYLTDVVQLDLMQSGNVIQLVSKIYGKDMPALTWDKIMSKFKTSKDFEGAVEDSLGLSQELRDSLKLTELNAYINGKGRIGDISQQLSEEDRHDIFTSGFEVMEEVTKEGGFDKLQAEDVPVVVDAGINMLQDGSQDAKTTDRLLDWVGSQKYRDLVKKGDPRKAQALGNMVITRARDSITSPDLLSTLDDNVTFNVDTGLFEQLISASEVSSSNSVSRIGADAKRVQAVEQKKKLDRLNSRVKNFLDFSDSNIALKEMSQEQKLSWLLKQGSGEKLPEGVRVIGGFLEVPKVTAIEAVKANRKASDIKAEKDKLEEQAGLPNQVTKLKAEIEKLRGAGVKASGSKESAILKIMKDNTNLTYAEALKLAEEEGESK